MKRLSAVVLTVGALLLGTPAGAVAAPYEVQDQTEALWINPNKPCTTEGRLFGSIRAKNEFLNCKKIGERPWVGNCIFLYFEPIKLYCTDPAQWDYPDWPGDGSHGQTAA
ncbi:hypothetical protein [Streptomyces sp. NPDC059788]|uniref:hypothetical protein n=1 Tax=Streptomyces sp. NPDC059788 TaxID=3346948 RepID=UPI0036680C33